MPRPTIRLVPERHKVRLSMAHPGVGRWVRRVPLTVYLDHPPAGPADIARWAVGGVFLEVPDQEERQEPVQAIGHPEMVAAMCQVNLRHLGPDDPGQFLDDGRIAQHLLHGPIVGRFQSREDVVVMVSTAAPDQGAARLVFGVAKSRPNLFVDSRTQHETPPNFRGRLVTGHDPEEVLHSTVAAAGDQDAWPVVIPGVGWHAEIRLLERVGRPELEAAEGMAIPGLRGRQFEKTPFVAETARRRRVRRASFR